MKMTKLDKEKIAKAVVAAESKTSGEIVPVILSKSDAYPAAHFRMALIIGMLFSFVCYYGYDFEDPIMLLWIQIPGMITGYFLAHIGVVKRMLTTKSELEEEVHQKALEIFYHNKVSITRDRTGIMIYISLLEKKVQVLADCGINEKVAKEYWNDLVAKLGSEIGQGNLVDGLTKAIAECGRSLESNFPIKSDDTNEIKDELITDL
ncbi:MAG: putative membrane protein [Thermoproteota archaeon]|jgi:putative membrane protein